MLKAYIRRQIYTAHTNKIYTNRSPNTHPNMRYILNKKTICYQEILQ